MKIYALILQLKTKFQNGLLLTLVYLLDFLWDHSLQDQHMRANLYSLSICKEYYENIYIFLF